MILIFSNGIGQTFEVIEAKRSFYGNGKRIKKGDTLNLKTEFLVKEKGKLHFIHPNQWPSYYGTSQSYRLDSLFEKIITTKEYMKHDSIFHVLKSANIDRCDFNYEIVCTPIFGGYAHSYADNIKQDGDYRIETKEPSIRLEWEYPVDYRGLYYILFSNMFNEFIDLQSTRKNAIDIDLLKYRSEKAILYKLISEECRESDLNIIILR